MAPESVRIRSMASERLWGISEGVSPRIVRAPLTFGHSQLTVLTTDREWHACKLANEHVWKATRVYCHVFSGLKALHKAEPFESRLQLLTVANRLHPTTDAVPQHHSFLESLHPTSWNLVLPQPRRFHPRRDPTIHTARGPKSFR